MCLTTCVGKTKIYVIEASDNDTPKATSTLAGVSLTGEKDSSKRLILVQTCDQEIWDELCRIGVKKEFIESHKNKQRWYISDGPDAQPFVPDLPSQTSKLDYIKLRFITARQYDGFGLVDRVCIAHIVDGSTKPCGPNCLDHVPGPGAAVVVPPFIPVTQKIPGTPVMFVHTYVSVWFHLNEGGKGWTGVVLFDPPPFTNGVAWCDQYAEIIPKKKNFPSEPFLALSPLFRLIAGEWDRMSRYIRRELETVEFNLEAAHHSVSQCENYLVRLTTYRRRLCSYIDLTRQQLASISHYGCKAWPVNKKAQEMKEQRKDLRKDFKYVVEVLEQLSDRLKDDMNLLLGLRAVFLNRAMTGLAFVGVLFLPFNSVAGILGMSGKYGPGTKNFWVYWACLAPMMFAVLIFHQVYSTAQRPRLRAGHTIGNWVNVSSCLGQWREGTWALWRARVTRPRPRSEDVGDMV